MAKGVRQPLRLEKAGSGFSSRNSSTDTVILAQWDPFWTSDLQNSKTEELCWLKPLNLCRL